MCHGTFLFEYDNQYFFFLLYLLNPLQIGQQQPFVVERAHEPRVYDCHFTPVEDVGDGSAVASPIGRRLLPLEVLYGGEHVNGRCG